jgi:hypothetical protein
VTAGIPRAQPKLAMAGEYTAVDGQDASAEEAAQTHAADELASMQQRHDELVRRLDSGSPRAPRRAEPGLDAALDHAMSEFGSDELGRLSSSVEVTKPRQSTHSSSSDAAQEVLARDSDAVVSVFYPEQRWIGALLSTVDGGFGAVYYFAQVECLGLCAIQVLVLAPGAAETAGLPEPNALLYVNAALMGAASVALTFIIGSARSALRPGGALEQLKVGEVMISEKDSTTLSRWRGGAWAWSGLWVLLSLLPWRGAFGLPPFGSPNTPTEARVELALRGLVSCTVFPVALSGWWASMRTASCLCRDEVIEVIHKVRTVAPTSGDWDAAVAQPALGLIEKMKLLSDGWSGGLAGFGVFFWLGALAYFTNAINAPLCEGLDAASGSPPGTQRTVSLMLVASMSTLPFLLALDIAATSSWCDNLMEELNDSRANHGPESHLKIQWLETTLRQLVRPAFPLCARVCVNDYLRRVHIARTDATAWASRSRGLESSTKDPWRPTLPRSTPPSAASSQPCSRLRLSGSMPRRVTTSARCPRRRQARFKLLWHHGATPAASTT